MAANLSIPFREALMGVPDITSKLGTWMAEPAIFTRRPVPDAATYPAIAISPNIVRTDADFLTSRLPVIVRDITVYGEGGAPASETDHYRIVEELADLVFDLFHRNPQSLLVDGHHVVNIVASGPIPAPTEHERLIGRAVTVTVTLHRNP